MEERLAGKVAVVTGAASGQGRATVLALVAEGARVMAGDINAEALAQLKAEVGEAVETAVCNVTNPDDMKRLIETAERTFGRLNAMLNVAGFLGAGSILETSDETLNRVIDINLKGVFYGCKYAIPALQRAGGGAIVNWGSVNSFVAEPDIAVYNATKGAVLMLTKSVALEHAADDIRANCICPGGVWTPMVKNFFPEGFEHDEAAQRAYQPLGLIYPEEVAQAAVFLVSDESRKITGTSITIDGGYTAR